jgi:hypothetical protein
VIEKGRWKSPQKMIIGAKIQTDLKRMRMNPQPGNGSQMTRVRCVEADEMEAGQTKRIADIGEVIGRPTLPEFYNDELQTSFANCGLRCNAHSAIT